MTRKVFHIQIPSLSTLARASTAYTRPAVLNKMLPLESEKVDAPTEPMPNMPDLRIDQVQATMVDSQANVSSDSELRQDTRDFAEAVGVEWPESKGENTPVLIEELAVIPEASPVQTSARRSKRRAGSVDEDSTAQATRLKTLHNEGDKATPVLSSPFDAKT